MRQVLINLINYTLMKKWTWRWLSRVEHLGQVTGGHNIAVPGWYLCIHRPYRPMIKCCDEKWRNSAFPLSILGQSVKQQWLVLNYNCYSLVWLILRLINDAVSATNVIKRWMRWECNQIKLWGKCWGLFHTLVGIQWDIFRKSREILSLGKAIVYRPRLELGFPLIQVQSVTGTRLYYELARIIWRQPKKG